MKRKSASQNFLEDIRRMDLYEHRRRIAEWENSLQHINEPYIEDEPVFAFLGPEPKKKRVRKLKIGNLARVKRARPNHTSLIKDEKVEVVAVLEKRIAVKDKSGEIWFVDSKHLEYIPPVSKKKD